MSNSDGGWISLFSGGKESSWALYRALESGRDVRRLVLIHPPANSQMYHAPAIAVARLAARSIGIPIVDVGIPVVDIEPPDIGGDVDPRSRPEDTTAIEPLEDALRTLDAELDGGVSGVITGTVESEFQADRLRSMCDRIGCEFAAPLWQAEPTVLLETMIEAGLEIVVVEVTAPGFDESWLGRQLDSDAVADLEALTGEYGVHPLGEGGEFETIVTDGPHMSRRISLEFERVWHGNWGTLRVTDARLETPPPGDDHHCEDDSPPSDNGG
ncbi:diphthine--ammonia ligase [Natronorubrum thiooxidans]|uniref:Metal-binding-domain/4Fe-4S-binding-domain containing ABC transporter, ATP-binding protein n=1 Tax=Natronorubrum thiooxidans TaxID=308853 RepID=A0A1N7G720_9EURY|nr:diphthine--ammonia ligase [Natronorubrum thiooxidans]SIS08368.1 metal-binding-domain/4Fe-4S-binding-domain containing ABC transporter, ATP-binding protein [Natronorubrum thiooxidans]